MYEGSDLQQYVSVFTNIIIDFVILEVDIEEEDKENILLCSLLCFYDHLMTTLTYEKILSALM